jgi:predicted lipoprotein with Yx(FWY)xxD motif
MRRSTRGAVSVIALVCATVLVLALGAGGAGAKTKRVVKVTKVPGVGAVLATSDGHTLYTLTDDAGAAVECTDACAGAWPPYTVSATAKVKAPKGVKSLSTTSDSHQVTWKGLPLYTFSGDASAKTANGDGITSFGGTWNVVRAGKRTAAATPTTAANRGSGYSGY